MNWTLPKAAPLDPAAVYDGLALEEVLLRFPLGGTSGGHLVFARTSKGAPAAQRDLVVPLEPGEPEALRQLLLDFVQARLTQRGLLEAGATASLEPVAAPTAPVIDKPLGTL